MDAMRRLLSIQILGQTTRATGHGLHYRWPFRSQEQAISCLGSSPTASRQLAAISRTTSVSAYRDGAERQ
jgi:hypothetical protein